MQDIDIPNIETTTMTAATTPPASQVASAIAAFVLSGQLPASNEIASLPINQDDLDPTFALLEQAEAELEVTFFFIPFPLTPSTQTCFLLILSLPGRDSSHRHRHARLCGQLARSGAASAGRHGAVQDVGERDFAAGSAAGSKRS